MKLKLEDILYRGLGSLDLTVEKLEEVISTLVKEGDLTRKQGEELVKKWQQRGDEKKDEIEKVIEKKLKDLGFSSREDVEDLTSRVSALEKEVDRLKEVCSENPED